MNDLIFIYFILGAILSYLFRREEWRTDSDSTKQEKLRRGLLLVKSVVFWPWWLRDSKDEDPPPPSS